MINIKNVLLHFVSAKTAIIIIIIIIFKVAMTIFSEIHILLALGSQNMHIYIYIFSTDVYCFVTAHYRRRLGCFTDACFSNSSL